MPSLKDLKNRIASVKSTRKITSAMKMVAGSKLRRAQEHAEAARPYANYMARMLSSLAGNLVVSEATPKLLVGTGREDTVLLIVMTSDRGLCGAYNSAVLRETRRMIGELESQGKTVKLFCIGRKGRDLLRRDHASKIVHAVSDIGRKRVGYEDAEKINALLLEMFEGGQFDVCHMVFNRFQSAISQIVTVKQLIPFGAPVAKAADSVEEAEGAEPSPTVEAESGTEEGVQGVADETDALFNAVGVLEPEDDDMIFEPGKEAILAALLPRALGVAVYGALLESAAGEQGARMTAMDNATRNAGDMINRLTLNYNRSRQAYITKELIEIISGAEAV